jgi:50S ribosomal protein L16 3-hydroxylase
MNLQTLLGDVTKAEFLDHYFHRLPFSSATTAEPVCHLGTWDVLGEILRQPDADRMVVRAGEPYAGPLPTTPIAAQTLVDEGFTILLRHAEQHHAELRRLADAFATDLQAPVNIHIYATPPGCRGFTWHYDAEDVFIMQTAGNKQYWLRKNTVHPWPLVETIPENMNYPREIMPLLRVELNAGDWLYIPCGYWHQAKACAEPIPHAPAESPASADGDVAISLALGVMSPAAIRVYDFLRPRLMQSLLWRQRLPVDHAGDLTANDSGDSPSSRLSEIFQNLAEDLARILRDPNTPEQFRQWLHPPR